MARRLRSLLVIALALLVLAGLEPASAAPLVPDHSASGASRNCPAEPDTACGPLAGPDLALPLLPSSAERVLRLGSTLLGGATVGFERTETSVAPIPLPAAAWLILAGMGMLGVASRRRREALPSLRRRPAPHRLSDQPGLAPLSGALRDSALADTHRFFGSRLRRPRCAPLRLLCRLSLRSWPRHAFPPGTASSAVPLGGSLAAHPPMSERAPPAIVGRSPAPGSSGPAGSGRASSSVSPFSPPRRRTPRLRGGLRFRTPSAVAPVEFDRRAVAGSVRKAKNGSNPHLRTRLDIDLGTARQRVAFQTWESTQCP